MKKIVGCVSEQERDEILNLFERRNGLAELAKVLSPNNTELYEKLVADMGENATRFQAWWDDAAAKYNWESAADGRWEIDFQTCKIYLVTEI